ncbi:plasmid mobilization protein [Paraburkholderia sp. GAS334]|uniref:plasmid mobilization protein n=1 Tax=Paraburkholderia sp. GAS334 TaxID=3035131 RepID=UPI003D22E993
MDDVPRRKHQPIRVWCLPAEKELIEASARDAGMSVSRYWRNVGIGYKIEVVIDARLVLQLAKINGDSGTTRRPVEAVADEQREAEKPGSGPHASSHSWRSRPDRYDAGCNAEARDRAEAENLAAKHEGAATGKI